MFALIYYIDAQVHQVYQTSSLGVEAVDSVSLLTDQACLKGQMEKY